MANGRSSGGRPAEWMTFATDTERMKIESATKYYGFSRIKFMRLAVVFACLHPREFAKFVRTANLEDGFQMRYDIDPYARYHEGKEKS